MELIVGLILQWISPHKQPFKFSRAPNSLELLPALHPVGLNGQLLQPSKLVYIRQFLNEVMAHIQYPCLLQFLILRDEFEPSTAHVDSLLFERKFFLGNTFVFLHKVTIRRLAFNY